MTPTLATQGTIYNRLIDALNFTEKMRKIVDTHSDRIRDRTNAELTNRHHHLKMKPPTPAQVRSKYSAELGKDPLRNDAVGDEQWGCRLVNVYALVELVRLKREERELNLELLRLAREQTQLLQLIAAKWAGDDPTAVNLLTARTAEPPTR